MDMTVDDLSTQIRQGRSTRLEWLAESVSLDTIATALTAMANAQGGTLIVGIVGQSAATIGVKDGNEVADRIVRAALAIEPRLIISYPQVIRMGDRPVVAAHVPRGMPHVYSYDGRFLIRQETENLALPPRELRRLFLERGDLSFETEAVSRATLDDLDWEAAAAYLRDDLGVIGETQLEQTMIRRGCLSDSGGKMRPTYAGILLFGKEPQRFVHNATVMAARFTSDTMTDKFIKQDIGGSLPVQLRRAEAFLRDHLRKDVHLGKGMARSESYEYPLEAARELVVNAVAHRDYSIDGDCIHLNIFRGRLEVVSPGSLPGPMTLDNLRNERFSRNPVIVQVLSDMRFIERLGYGVDRVIALMHERRLREPVFEDTHGSFRATLHNDPTSETGSTSVEPPALPLFGGIYNGIAVNPRQESAIAFLHAGNSRITNKDLQALYPEVHAETIRRDLADLVTKNVLRKLGEKRGSYYMLQADAP